MLNATKALQIIILTWALRTKTTNSRVSFIDLYMYLVFPKNFKIVFSPHTNTVILLGPYCGTITEPGLPVVYEITHFFNDYCAFSRSFLTSLHSTLSTILPPEPPKENKTNTDTTLKNDRVDLIKRISKSDISVGRNWILFWWGKKVFLTGKKKRIFVLCLNRLCP